MNRVGWRKRLILAIKVAATVAVLWGVGRYVLRTWDDLRRHELVLQISPAYLTLAGLLYLAGLSLCALFYDDVLQASPAPIPRLAAVRAYVISHLGKYVPGKAMVVLMRAGMSAQRGAKAATAAIATFYETLVMMASGGLIAAAGFAVGGASPQMTFEPPLLGKVSVSAFQLASLGGLGLGLAFLVVVWPSVFRRLALAVSLPIPGAGPEALPRFTSGLLGLGLVRTSLAWLAMGLSQLAVVRGLAPWGHRELLGLLPLVAASVALATVAGFVIAVIPGGLGVREGVLMYALGPALGVDLAVVSALVLRLVWVAAEFTAALAIGPMGSRGGEPAAAPQPSTSTTASGSP